MLDKNFLEKHSMWHVNKHYRKLLLRLCTDFFFIYTSKLLNASPRTGLIIGETFFVCVLIILG